MYSLEDLMRIEQQGRSCSLFSAMVRLARTGEDHIRDCSDCRKSAQHFCLICSSSTPIFGFEVGKIWTCTECRSIFHLACIKRADLDCPLCLRDKVRESKAERKPSISEVRPR